MHTEVKEWIDYGNEDFNLFQVVGNNPSVKLALIYYHAQQAAEKWLKGLMILNGLTAPRLHDLTTLSRYLVNIYPELNQPKWQARCSLLSIYATRARYPDSSPSENEEPTFYQIQEALLAFRTFTKEKLGDLWQD